MLAYGIRGFAAFFFFFVTDPKSPGIWICSILMIVGSNLEGLASYAFWVKRVPKDIRALMNGYFSSIARTGQLAVSASAFFVIQRYSIQSLFLIVAIGDFSVFICTFFLAGTKIFHNDKIEGKAGKDAHVKMAAEKK